MTCRRDRPAFLLAAVALGLGSCGKPGAGLAPVESARAELAAGNATDARIKLEKLVADGTERSEVAAYLGEAALAQGDLGAAHGWLGDGAFSPETSAHGFRMLGRLYFARGNLAAAGQAFDRSLAIEPGNPELWVDIGRLRYRGGEQLQALEAGAKAVALDPRNAAALQFRGQLARDAQGLIAGAEWFARALEAQPGNVDLRVEYAATLGDVGRPRTALAILRGGKGSSVSSPRGLFVQAVIAARGGHALLARELLQRSGFERDNVPAAMMLSAIVDLQAGNHASAVQTLDRLYRRQPDNGRVVDLLAFALSRTGGERELIRRFAARAENPLGTPYLRTLVARSYEALDDRTGAARFLDMAASTREGFAILPGDAPPEALEAGSSGDGLGARDFVRNALAGHQMAAAVQRARDFARRFPGSGDAHAILGDAELAAGNKAAARAAYLRSAAVRRSWPLILRLVRSQPDRASARRLLEGYVRNNPGNGDAAAMLADAYAAQGQWARAAVLLDHAMALGQSRVPWVVAARSLAASKLGDRQAALDFALEAHALQPMNPSAIAALIAALPAQEAAARDELRSKLRSLTAR
ncbi:MAG: tetratricopeptide repeat protein [Erythrobacter sp.]|jgi:tetratricopeptide (TPR) repeat protein